jgi:hypothetical protein
MRIFALSALAVLVACGSSDAPRPDDAAVADVPPAAPIEVAATPAVTPAFESDLDRAIAVARALDAHPDATDSVLTAHAMVVETLESLMLRIASDSVLSAEYVRRLSSGGD